MKRLYFALSVALLLWTLMFCPLTAPRFEIMNDARHIRNIRTENYYGN